MAEMMVESLVVKMDYLKVGLMAYMTVKQSAETSAKHLAGLQVDMLGGWWVEKMVPSKVVLMAVQTEWSKVGQLVDMKDWRSEMIAVAMRAVLTVLMKA